MEACLYVAKVTGESFPPIKACSIWLILDKFYEINQLS